MLGPSVTAASETQLLINSNCTRVIDSMGCLNKRSKAVNNYCREHKKQILHTSCAALFLGANVWLIFSILNNFHHAIAFMVFVIIGWVTLLYCLIKVYLPHVFSKILFTWRQTLLVERFRTIVCGAVGVGLLAYVLYLCIEDQIRLVTLASLIVMIIVSMIVSAHPARIKWTPVLWGLFLQYLMGFLVLKWKAGATAVRWTTEQFVRFLSYTENGTLFAFGFLPAPPNICGVEATLPFATLPTIVLSCSLCSALYYLGVIQWFLVKIAALLQNTMQTTAAESLNAVAAVFLGPTEAVVMMRNALSSMTISEIMATMTAGFSMISASLFPVYIAFGACPLYLLAANIMSAPALLAVSKIIYPEVQKSKQKDIKTFVFPPPAYSSVMESICSAALQAIRILFAICVNLIVFVALVTLFDNIIQFTTTIVGFKDVTFNKLLGYAFFPLAYIMGVSDADDSSRRFDETLRVAQLIGTRALLNEFIAYQQMSDMLLKKQLGGRSHMMASFALAGYANPCYIGVQLGVFRTMIPERKKTFAKAAVRALISGSITCFMTASVAGTIISGSENCMPSAEPPNCAPIG